MLKRKIDKATFDALTDAVKEFYKEKDGSYYLEAEDATGLTSALEAQKEIARKAKEELDELKRVKGEADEAARLAAEEAAKRTGDVAAIETSWKAKLETEKTAGATREEKLKKQIEKLLVDNVATSIANDISLAPDLILPHIQKRLSAELSGDDAATRVLGLDGKPSALTLDDLKAEFVANAKFAAIIKGSNASGGNAGQNRGGGNATKKISEMTEVERVAAHKANPDDFNRRVAAGE